MTLRIVADLREDGTTLGLSGHMWAEHVEHVRMPFSSPRLLRALSEQSGGMRIDAMIDV